MYYFLVPCISQNVRLSCIFIHWVAYISSPPPPQFVTLSNLLEKISFYVNIFAALVRVWFSLFSFLFLSFYRLPNTPLEDENSRDAWLSLLALKRKVASLVVGQLQVVLKCLMLQVLYLWLPSSQTRVEYHLMSLPWPILTML